MFDRKEYGRLWRKRNANRRKIYQRAWRLKNPNKISEHGKRHYRKYHTQHLEKQVRYRNGNLEKCREMVKISNTKRLRNDPSYKLRKYLGGRVWTALKGSQKSLRTIDLLGCSIRDFWIYLESKFEVGMTRENYGKVWHVDHLIPCAIFDLSKREHQKRCFHFSNLQPLFAHDNLSKSSKVVTEQYNLI